MEYTIVIEETPQNFAAYAPDLPGCVATGATRDDVVREMRSAIALHIESLREHNEPVPTPSSTAAVVDVSRGFDGKTVPPPTSRSSTAGRNPYTSR